MKSPLKNQIVQTNKVPLKGFNTTSTKVQTKKINGKQVIHKMTMPTKFVPGENNPVKLKKSKNAAVAMVQDLGMAMKKLNPKK